MNHARLPDVSRGERNERTDVEAARRSLALIRELKVDALHELGGALARFNRSMSDPMRVIGS
jgi:hypothetical protein